MKNSELYEWLLGVYNDTLEAFEAEELDDKEVFVKSQEYQEIVSVLGELSKQEEFDEEKQNMLIFAISILDFNDLIEVFEAMDKSKGAQAVLDAYKNGGR